VIKLPILLLAAAASLAGLPALAQSGDVRVLSRQQADAILADPAPEEASEPAPPPNRRFALPSQSNTPGNQVVTSPPQPRFSLGNPTEVPLQFRTGSFELTPQSKANLSALAGSLKAPGNTAKRIRITGHTDRSGSAAVNQRLSQRRAQAAADFVAKQGVARGRIEAVGRGFAEPLPGVPASSARNRRVEVVRVR
jgi:OmpA-OmpF porin, OOP family